MPDTTKPAGNAALVAPSGSTETTISVANSDTFPNNPQATCAQELPDSAPDPSPACLSPTEDVQAVCVDVIDLGVQKMPWGTKARTKYVYELDETKGNGYRVTVSRTFNTSMHELSAMGKAMAQWLGHVLTAKEAAAFKPTSMKGKSCTLKLSHQITIEGNEYSKIEEIKPAGENAIKPSGSYKRWGE